VAKCTKGEGLGPAATVSGSSNGGRASNAMARENALISRLANETRLKM